MTKYHQTGFKVFRIFIVVLDCNQEFRLKNRTGFRNFIFRYNFLHSHCDEFVDFFYIRILESGIIFIYHHYSDVTVSDISLSKFVEHLFGVKRSKESVENCVKSHFRFAEPATEIVYGSSQVATDLWQSFLVFMGLGYVRICIDRFCTITASIIFRSDQLDFADWEWTNFASQNIDCFLIVMPMNPEKAQKFGLFFPPDTEFINKFENRIRTKIVTVF